MADSSHVLSLKGRVGMDAALHSFFRSPFAHDGTETIFKPAPKGGLDPVSLTETRHASRRGIPKAAEEGSRRSSA